MREPVAVGSPERAAARRGAAGRTWSTELDTMSRSVDHPALRQTWSTELDTMSRSVDHPALRQTWSTELDTMSRSVDHPALRERPGRQHG
jgi:hypothetical protein